jgi:2-keto-4-pentenoate hydratase/2-oxohepta-3-ene-1,7-dioic acid hydratase in catechol pathway
MKKRENNIRSGFISAIDHSVIDRFHCSSCGTRWHSVAIYCIGRNYAAHAREMGSDPNREPPFFFQKPSDAVQLVPPGQTVDHPYPSLTKNYHYEVELLAALNRGGRNIPIEGALKHVYGYAIGLYMTRRDWQRARATRKSPGKSARALTSRPIGPLHPVAQCRPLHSRKHLAEGEPPGQAERRPEANDPVSGRTDQ